MGKPWYKEDGVAIGLITIIMVSIVFSLIFYLEVICPKQ